MNSYVYVYEFKGALSGWCEEREPLPTLMLFKRIEWAMSNEEVR